MDRRVVIETPTTTNDEWGHPVKTWNYVNAVWASKVDKTETERNELDQTVAVNRTVFTIRYFSGLDTTARILCEGATYEIRGIKELGRREGLQITTERRR